MTGRRFLLALALAAVPGLARADGFTDLLAQYDLNGNGLLEARERAMLTAANTRDKPALASLPIVCDQDPDASALAGESASAGGENAAQNSRLRWEPFAEQLPRDGDQGEADEAHAEGQTADADYAPPESAPPQPRQPVQIRNAVQYRMLLNHEQAQPRSQPFAQAATFGPMVGRVRHYPRPGGGYAHHSCCAPSRASLYLAGY